MISLFERELVLDILLVVGQEMELRENSQYNLLMMEILHHILKGQDPMAVAEGMSSLASKGTTKAVSTSSVQTSSAANSSSSMSILGTKMKDEKAQRRTLATVRHGHFGGTWMQKQGEKRQFVSATAAVHRGVVDSRSKHVVQAKRKNRMAEPFIGSGKTLSAHTRFPAVDSGPATKRAMETLNKFCQRFMLDCYGPFMKSLKNEFRRDSLRLEESDKVVFFRLIWFFSQWWRASSSTRPKTSIGKDGMEGVTGKLIITMDLFTFKLVVDATDSFYNHKKYTRLAQSVALYGEMMHLLHDMYTSKDKTEHEMAMGLIGRLFYGQESLDQVPKLISRWTPGNYTREYLCDLVEVVHVSLKLLEANTKNGIEFVQKKGTSGNKDVSQKIAKMRTTAADFDIKSYLVRKIVSNQMITMYGHLLSQYKVNAPVVNHRIIAMFLRLMRVEVASPEVVDLDTPLNPLGTKRSTLEPMLYNLHMIMTMEQILNDTSIRGDKDFESLLQFSTSLMYKFWAAADANPMLYVECLFRHVSPNRFCESVTNMYVNDDLRMIAERAILLEEHLLLQEEYDDSKETRMNRRQDRDDADDEELEFTGDDVAASEAPDPNGQTESPKEKGAKDESESEESGEDNESNASINAWREINAESSHDIGRKRGIDHEGSDQQQRESDVEEKEGLPARKVARHERLPKEGESSDDDVDFGASTGEAVTLSTEN